MFEELLKAQINRRGFIKNTAAAIGSSSIVASTLSTKAAAQSLGAAQIAALLHIDPITLEYKVLGPCCTFCPTNFIVNHYQPVMMVEVVRGPVDSIFLGSLTTSLDVIRGGRVRHERQFKSFTVRIWEVPQWAVDIATGYQACRLCGPGRAKLSSTIGSLIGATSTCQTSGAMSLALDSLNEALGDCFPKLLYDSTYDLDWILGCAGDVAASNPVASMACSFGAGGALSGILGADYCIGNWGPLYPRQNAIRTTDPRMGAAITGYRALSLAEEKGYLGFSTSAALGKLQLTYPTRNVGFKVGTTAGRTAIQSNSASRTDSYCFTWWLPVACCKSISDIKGLCTPNLLCV